MTGEAAGYCGTGQSATILDIWRLARTVNEVVERHTGRVPALRVSSLLSVAAADGLLQVASCRNLCGGLHYFTRGRLLTIVRRLSQHQPVTQELSGHVHQDFGRLEAAHDLWLGAQLVSSNREQLIMSFRLEHCRWLRHAEVTSIKYPTDPTSRTIYPGYLEHTSSRRCSIEAYSHQTAVASVLRKQRWRPRPTSHPPYPTPPA